MTLAYVYIKIKQLSHKYFWVMVQSFVIDASAITYKRRVVGTFNWLNRLWPTNWWSFCRLFGFFRHQIIAESFNNVSQNISRDSPFQGKVLSSFPILGNCSGRDASFHQIWNIEILYVSKRQRQTGKLTQSAKFSTISPCILLDILKSKYFGIMKSAAMRSSITSASLCDYLPRKFVEAEKLF